MINIYDLLPYFVQTDSITLDTLAYDMKPGYVAFVNGQEIFGVDVNPDDGNIVAVHEVRWGRCRLEPDAKLEIYLNKPALVRTCINKGNQAVT